ncbi:hypothetical protein Gohar_008410 [Gossypium harknessii]|uniref:Uncharacterized protein n=1 Tax=Gossypium harknessii TaxID=34285 RepID=A0A7J9GJK0_9ROSI|nr:hypothetical protein [Gossypium harknessii]
MKQKVEALDKENCVYLQCYRR